MCIHQQKRTLAEACCVIYNKPYYRCVIRFKLNLGLGDISNTMIMRISSVKLVLWLVVNLHHLLSDGAAFNTQCRRSLTSYTTLSRSLSQMNRLWYCVACQWSTALCIKRRSIWKQVMEIYCGMSPSPSWTAVLVRAEPYNSIFLPRTVPPLLFTSVSIADTDDLVMAQARAATTCTDIKTPCLAVAAGSEEAADTGPAIGWREVCLEDLCCPPAAPTQTTSSPNQPAPWTCWRSWREAWRAAAAAATGDPHTLTLPSMHLNPEPVSLGRAAAVIRCISSHAGFSL